MDENLTFEKLPLAISQLSKKLDTIVVLLQDDKKQQTQQESEDQLLNVQETAKFLDLTVATIYTKASKGELPFMKRAKRIYFSKKDLMEFLRAGKRKANFEIDQEVDEYLNRNRRKW